MVPARTTGTSAVILGENENLQQPLTPVQQQFNQLSQKIEQQKQQLEQWQALIVLAQQWINGKLIPRYDQLTRQHGKLIERLHQASLQYALTAWESNQLHELIVQLCEQVLRHKLPDEQKIIEQIYQHYTAEKAPLHTAKTALGELPPQQRARLLNHEPAPAGLEADDLAASDPAASFEIRAQQQHAARQHQKQQHKMARLAQQQQAKAQQEKQQQASAAPQKSLKQLYQRLASILHPDRELDEQHKIMKTDLMQQATEAYQAQDLLSLIQLQAATKFNTHLNPAPLTDEQVQGYNLNLLKYSQQLDDEIARHRAKLGNLCGIERVETATPKAVIRKLKQEAALITEHNARLSQQIDALKDARAIKALLRQYV